MNTRNKWVDYSKGIAILGIIYIHVISGLQGSGLWPYNQLQATLLTMFDKLGVGIFFFTAALFTAGSLQKRGALPFLKSKAIGLFYPYLIWSVLKWGNKMVLGGQTNSQTNVQELLAIWIEPLGHLWFLYALFLAYLLYVGVRMVGGKTAVIFTLLSLTLFLLPTSPLTPLPIAKLMQNLPFFAAGLLYKTYLWGKTETKNLDIPLILLSATGAASWAWFVLQTDKHNPFLVLPYAIFGLLAVYLLAGFLADRGWGKGVEIIGRYSLPIYLSHTLIAAAVRIALKLAGLQNSWGHFAAGMIIGTLLPIALYLLGKRLKFPYLFEWKTPIFFSKTKSQLPVQPVTDLPK